MARHALPARIARWLESTRGRFEVVAAVGGGCINRAVRLRLDGGDAFLKYHVRAPSGTFAAEAEGLRALREAGTALRVAQVLEVLEVEAEGKEAGCGALLLEWLEPAAADAGFAERLGSGLAALHRVQVRGWGWPRDGFIGSLPQANGWAGGWAEFWRDRRLVPQLERARGGGFRIATGREWDALFTRLPALLAAADADGPSLLHGDLWSGNVLAAAGGAGAEPALVDPAVYQGHREVDLAMAELFGGFPAGFRATYEAAWPLQPGYQPARRAAYQLYYLLVHVNLFGAGYVAPAERALREALAGA